jgi:uncharacterized protein (DUF2336 family)
MNTDFARLESLARLAKEASTEGRQELLREITDMFLEAPGSLSEKEIDYFGDIMGRLAFEVEMQVRQHLAVTLSTVGAAPPDLINRLANDQIEVARPVLMKSGVLKDGDLLEIVRTRSQEHLLAVSKRPTVSEKVSDALVEKGDDDVLGSLAGNVGAALSRITMEKMIERSKGNDALQAPLIDRRDLPSDLKKKMFAFVSDALRQHLLSSGKWLDEGQVDDLMAETAAWFDSDSSDVAKDGEPSPAEKFIQRKDQLHQLNAALLLKLIQDGKIAEFIAGIARMARVDLTTARQAVLESSGEKLAVMCKALEINNQMFAILVDLTDPKKLRSQDDKVALVGVYSRITAESAQRALRFLRTRKMLKKENQSKVDWTK